MKILMSKSVLEKCVAQCKKYHADFTKKAGDDFQTKKCKECGDDFLAYKRSCAKFCCLCSRKRHMVQRGRAIVLKKGYPKTDALQYEELQQYYKTPKIECLLCGNHYDTLGLHLKAFHGLNAKEYKSKFGLYAEKGLAGEDFKKRIIDDFPIKHKAFMALALSKEHQGNALKKAHESIQKNGMVRPARSATLHHYNTNGITEASKKSASDNRDLVDVLCSKCGDKLEEKKELWSAHRLRCVIKCFWCSEKNILRMLRIFKNELSGTQNLQTLQKQGWF